MNFTDDQLREIMQVTDCGLPADMAVELARQLLLTRASLRAKHKVGDMKLTVRVSQTVDSVVVQDEVTITDDITRQANMGDVLWNELNNMRRRVSDQIDQIIRGER